MSSHQFWKTCIFSQKFDIELVNINRELPTDAVPAIFSALRGHKGRFSSDLTCRAILFLTFKIIPLKGIILISERYNYTFKRYNRKVKKKSYGSFLKPPGRQGAHFCEFWGANEKFEVPNFEFSYFGYFFPLTVTSKFYDFVLQNAQKR